MRALELYEILNNNFINKGIKDVGWAKRMPDLEKHLFSEFKQNGGMGLMCDFTDEIKKVYTTVFLSEKVLSKILKDNGS